MKCGVASMFIDNSETYIEMSRLADEIQALRPNKQLYHEGDYFASKDYAGNWYVTLATMNGKKRGRSIYFKTDSAVWLPCQGQLQQLYGSMDSCLSAMYYWGEETRVGRTSPYYGYDSDAFASMEQLWLAFVMKERYGKVWNGIAWIKEV